MPDITTWDGMLVASGRDELIGNFDHYTKPDLSYANREIRASVRPIYPWCPEPVEPTPFEVNKEVVSIQDHNRFNPGPFQEGSAIFPGHGVIAEDHNHGKFADALTNAAPESYDPGPVGSPVELNSLDIGPVNKTADKGWWTVDGADFRDSELDALNETTNFDDRGYSPISGEGVFKPHFIEPDHFTPDRGGDSLTGESGPNNIWGSRPNNVWTNGSATSFEDKHVGDYDANDVGIQEGCGQNVPIGSRFPGIDRSIKGIQVVYFENIGGTAGPGGSTYMTETFEPAAGMNSFGESLNPVLEVGSTSGPGGSTFMTGQFEMPTDNVGGQSGPGGTSF